MNYRLKTLSQDFEADDFLGAAVVSSVDEGARAVAAGVLERDGLVTELDKDFEFDTGIPEELDFESSEYEGALPETEPGYVTEEDETEDAIEAEMPAVDVPESIEIEIPEAPDVPEGVEIEIPEAADITAEPVQAPDIAFEIPHVMHINRGLTKLKFDTFTFEEDFPRILKGVVTIVVIAAAIIILLFYLLHQ